LEHISHVPNGFCAAVSTPEHYSNKRVLRRSPAIHSVGRIRVGPAERGIIVRSDVTIHLRTDGVCSEDVIATPLPAGEAISSA